MESSDGTEIVHLTIPQDANLAGNVHGGTIMKLIEQAGWIAATRHAHSTENPLLAALARLEHMDFWKVLYALYDST